MLKKILTAIVVLLAAVLIFASTRPDSMRVERSVIIAGTPEQIFNLINDFNQWPRWSPYEKMDPNMNRKVSPNSSGIGAWYEWEGNSKAGKGRMDITSSVPHTNVGIKLEMIEPMHGLNAVEFSIEPGEGGQKVTWRMDAPSPFISKVVGLFINLDKIIGAQFEEGLAKMKTVVETGG